MILQLIVIYIYYVLSSEMTGHMPLLNSYSGGKMTLTARDDIAYFWVSSGNGP